MDTITKDVEIHKAISVEQIKRCYRVMKQLRPQLKDDQKFVEQVQRQFTQGYHLAYCQLDGEIKAVSGYRMQEFMAWGKVLYIDDLVSDETTRGSGYGGKLLKWVIEQGKNAQCDQIHLDSGPQRHDAHRLYLNHRFKITGHHFSLQIN